VYNRIENGTAECHFVNTWLGFEPSRKYSLELLVRGDLVQLRDKLVGQLLRRKSN